MSLQLYQVDQKSFLLDFKSLNTVDHPDAKRVESMTKAAMHKEGSPFTQEFGMLYKTWHYTSQNL